MITRANKNFDVREGSGSVFLHKIFFSLFLIEFIHTAKCLISEVLANLSYYSGTLSNWPFVQFLRKTSFYLARLISYFLIMGKTWG